MPAALNAGLLNKKLKYEESYFFIDAHLSIGHFIHGNHLLCLRYEWQ
jgi:hypothetical protein